MMAELFYWLLNHFQVRWPYRMGDDLDKSHHPSIYRTALTVKCTACDTKSRQLCPGQSFLRWSRLRLIFAIIEFVS